MSTLFNWLILVAFGAASIMVARWVIVQAHARWSGPDTLVSRGFLYLLILATIGGLSYVCVSILYFEILRQGAFLDLVGLSGALKFLLIFAGLWYGAAFALRRRGQGGHGK